MNLKEKVPKILRGSFRYNYNPYSLKDRVKESFNKNSKPVVLAVVSFFLIAGLYSINNTITGYISYQDNVEKELNNTKQVLANIESEKASCLSELSDSYASLDECQATITTGKSSLSECLHEKSNLNDYSKALGNDLNTCEKEKGDFETQLKDKIESYNMLVRNSARSVCCGTFDVIEGSVINWGISNDKFSCKTGPYSVNCSAGNTNY